MTPLQRFADKFIIEPYSGCWLWTSTTYRNGYGMFFINGKLVGAHRASWMLYRGEIPLGVNVLHRCDTPSCVNPDHLFIGSRSDNIQDSITKGRFHAAKGENSGRAKLTEDDVIKIRESKKTQRSVAKEFGISPTHVWYLRNGHYWRHIQWQNF